MAKQMVAIDSLPADIQEMILKRKQETAASVAKWRTEVDAYCNKKYGVGLSTIFFGGRVRGAKKAKAVQAAE